MTAPGPVSPSSIRQRKVLRAVTRVAGFRRGLERAVPEGEDEQAWLRRWLDPAQEQDNTLAAIERQYERIVNAWQDEIFDVFEQEAAAQGLVPVPPVLSDAADARRWTREAVEFGLVAKDTEGRIPGRWRRQVLYGFLSPELELPLRTLCAVRQVFAHRYTDADDEHRGRRVWVDLQELRAIFPRVSADIERAVDKLWPSQSAPAVDQAPEAEP